MTRPQAVLLLMVLAVFWSTGGVLIKWVVWPALAIAGMRSGIAALVLWGVLRRPRFVWSWLPISGALACATTMLLFVVATKWTTAANAIFLVYTAPIYVALLSAWFLHEPVKPRDWLMILLALGGLACFCFEQLTWAGLWGNVCALGSGVTMAWLVLCLRKQRADSLLETVLLGNIAAALVGLPFMFHSMPDATGWLALGVSGVFQLGIPYVLYCQAIKHVRAIDAVLVPIIEPILNPLWVFLVIGEVPSPWALVGGGIVLIAVTARGLLTAWDTESVPAPEPQRGGRIEA